MAGLETLRLRDGGAVAPGSLEVGAQPWRVIAIELEGSGANGQKEYLVKGSFQPEGYAVMLSNSTAVWEERMKAPEILKRLKVCIK